MVLEDDDVAALLSEVESFASQRIAAATERPEATISNETLTALSVEAAELGLIPSSGADAGFSLWEHCDHASSMAFNLGLLKLVGRANAGIAFAWHRSSLARAVAAAIGAELPGAGVLDAALVTTGHFGLARADLGNYLRANGTTADVAVLSDWLDRRHHETTVVTAKSWESLAWPVWHDGEIRWQAATRQELAVEACRPQHGFDELASFRVKLAPGAHPSILAAGADARKFYARILKLDMIGLLAVGAGAIRRAQRLASDYAAIRRQGGKIIAEHAAVQQMLGEIEMAGQQVDVMLRHLSRPIDEILLAEVAGLRALAHPMLCHGANQAMQVHGGIGYMRDAGPEKIVRDQNMLKLQAGGVREIPLLLAALNGDLA